MTDAERLAANLVEEFPDLRIEIDEPHPDNPSASWLVTVFRDGPDALPPVMIEWRPTQGFGISTPGPDEIGTGADEIYGSFEFTTRRVAELLNTGSKTSAPLTLAQVREELDKTHARLAELFGMKQAGVAPVQTWNEIPLGTVHKLSGPSIVSGEVPREIHRSQVVPKPVRSVNISSLTYPPKRTRASSAASHIPIGRRVLPVNPIASRKSKRHRDT